MAARRVRFLTWLLTSSTSAVLAFFGLPIVADDALIDDLEKTVSISWRASEDGGPAIDVAVAIKGKAATLASACGELQIDELIDEAGNPLETEIDDDLVANTDAIAAMWPDPRFLELDSDFFAPTQTVTVRIRSSPKNESIRTLRGSLALQTGGVAEVVTIKRPFDAVGGVLESKSLADLGIVLAMNRDRSGNFLMRHEVEKVELKGTWQKHPIVRYEFLSDKGKRIDPGSSCSSGEHGRAGKPIPFMEGIGFYKPLPNDADLRVTIHKDRKKVQVPFEFHDIVIPPVPEEIVKALADKKRREEAKTVSREELRQDDPLLADMQVTTSTQWGRSFRGEDNSSRPVLRVA